MKRWLTALAATALMAAPAAAQNAGTVSAGIYGTATRFDAETTLSELPQLGAGGYLGIFFAPNLAVEGGASFTDTETREFGRDAGWVPIRARLVYNFPATETFYPMIGAGWAYQKYTGALGDETDHAVTGLIGFKNYFSDQWALRMQADVDYVPSPFNEAQTSGDAQLNWTLSVGLHWDMFGGRSKDTDMDGVRDQNDACPGTPANVRVDSRGCRVDSDGDGVFDEADSCPNTPSGVRVNAQGCRVDSDGDGVYDEEDRCSATPAGVEVNATGCPVDTDRDGVADYQDQCPSTPAGAQVNAQGCQRDSDNDGVYDAVDRCPNTPANTEVDEVGCTRLFEDESEPLVLEGVNFETGSATLTLNSQTVLNRVAESLRGNPETRVRVVGHTDSTGSRQLNMNLSQERAQSVVDYLVSRGVRAGQLEAAGMGPDNPRASNDTAAGRAQNRRVELELIGN